jgi:hypothetical protein
MEAVNLDITDKVEEAVPDSNPLQEFLDGILADIKDIDLANINNYDIDDYLKVRRELNSKIAEQDEWAAFQYLEIDKVKNKYKKPLETLKKELADKFEPAIEAYARANTNDDKRFVEFKNGVVGFRMVGGMAVVINDAVKAVKWCEKHLKDALRIKPVELDKNVIKARYKSKGEIPDGIEITAPELKFYIE